MKEIDTGCKVVDNAKNLAEKKGLNPDRVFCPLIHVCSGESCMFNGKDNPEVKAMKQAIQIDTFYKRVERALPKNG